MGRCKQKILFLTPYAPSKRAAGENFTRQALDDLSKEHEIYLVYFKYKNDSVYKANSPNIEVIKICKNSFAIKFWSCFKIPFLFPVFTIRFSFRLLWLLKKIHNEKKIDMLFLDHSQMFLYGKFFPNVKKILLSHDVMYQRYARRLNSLAVFWVRHSENYIIKQHNAVLLSFSNKDKEILKRNYGVESKVINFYLSENVMKTVPQSIGDYFVFFGNWKRNENLDGLKWFFEKVFLKLKNSSKFKVIGPGLPVDLEKFLDSLGVECLGFLEEPYNEIANAKALIAPLFTGAGVKVKVVEALACGTPVIGNDIAFEGISSEFSKFMLMSTSVEYFVDLMLSLSFSIQERIEFRRDFTYKYGKNTLGEVLSI
jgi:glycosyltransferase involved in cell wall biosynthesis